MIKLNRPERPSILDSLRLQDEKKRIEYSYRSSSKERLKFKSQLLFPLKDILTEIGNGKCAYCETKIGTASNVHIDHYRPKGGAVGLDNEYAPDHYFWLAYEWENLVPACQMCSTIKKNIFPITEGFSRAPIMAVGDILRQENPLLIDPFFDDPSKYLRFTEDGLVNGQNQKGAITIEVLKLNRPPLVDARRMAIRTFKLDVESFDIMPSLLKRQMEIKINEILSESSKYEYSAALRTVLINWQPKNYFTEIPLPKKLTTTDALFTDDSFTFKDEVSSFIDITRFTIKSIEIANFKSIDHLVLNFLPAQDLNDRESWLLMLGDNGIGKSAILQAITLTLCGPDQFNILNIDPADLYKRNAIENGYVKVYSYEREEPYEIQFDANEFYLKPEAPPTILLAYGATRLLPKGNLKPHNTKATQINIANLFDYSVSLIDAKAWLLDQSEDNFEKRIVPVLIDLLDINGITKFTRTNSELFLGEIRLSEISDGYKSMIAMACDIMQSLSLQNTRFHETAGLVLIDELGNHLHPKWRLRIVSSLRMAFPKLQFIVSTHEPLCLRGLDHGEVVVLLTDKQRKIIALDKKVLPDHNLLRIDQLLTSDLFGLLDTVDPQTENKFNRYYELLVKSEKDRTYSENEEIEYYTRELYDKEILGNTPQYQVMFQLINENFAKNLIHDGFKTKAELKEDTIEQIQILINKKKIDWL